MILTLSAVVDMFAIMSRTMILYRSGMNVETEKSLHDCPTHEWAEFGRARNRHRLNLRQY